MPLDGTEENGETRRRFDSKNVTEEGGWVKKAFVAQKKC
jgi:hypothetical protein